MIARRIWLAAALMLAGCDTAQDDLPDGQPALWQVVAKGYANPGENPGEPMSSAAFLFGTIHALPDGTTWRGAAIDQAFAMSSALVVEIDNPGDPATADLFARLARTPGQPALLARVPVPDRPALQALLDRARMDSGAFASVESWGAALMLAGAVSLGESENGVDRAMIEAAEAAGKPVVALETAAGQLALFDTLPATDQSALLAATAREAAADQGAPIAAWLGGDIGQLERLGGKSLLADPRLRERLQSGRNRNWVQAVDAMIARGERPFVAVGAAHMLGADGLPALLAARGYTVRRVQ